MVKPGLIVTLLEAQEIKSYDRNINSEDKWVNPNTLLKFEDILPHSGVNHQNYRDLDRPGDFTLEHARSLTLFTAIAKEEFNLLEADPIFKEQLLNSNFSQSGILSLVKEAVADNLMNNTKTRGIWIGDDPFAEKSLHTFQLEAFKFYKVLETFCEEYGNAGNLFGYGMVSSALTAWSSLKRPENCLHAGRTKMETMTPVISISFGNLIKRCSKKRLLRKTDLKVYEEYSERLGYNYNVGECATVYVAWSGWYVLSCSEKSSMPFQRAKLIGSIEGLGMTNWASVDNIFKHPDFSPYGWAGVEALETPDWRCDPACVAALWAPFYCDLKRRATDQGLWPKSGMYEDWAYAVAQPVDNVALATGEILFESEVSHDSMLEYTTLFRRYDDILDVNTDAVTGEENNQLYAKLIPHFQKETSREKLAQICMKHADDQITFRKSISKMADTTGKGFQARMFARIPPFWYIWMSRYNVWHKFLLGMKSGMVPAEQALPNIRWEVLDSTHLIKVFEQAGCSCCVSRKCAIFLDAMKGNKLSDSKSSEIPAFRQLYTTFVAGILGVLLCHSSSCNCAERMAEYIDAEQGGEICRFILETVYSSEEDKLRYQDLLLELFDSDQFAIYRYAAAGVGYFFQELTQVFTGSMLEHCSTQKNSL